MQIKSSGSVPGDDLADEMYRFVLINTTKGEFVLDRHEGMAHQFVGYPVYDKTQLEGSDIRSHVDRHELVKNMSIYRGKDGNNMQITPIQKIWEFGAEADKVDYARILGVEPYVIDNKNFAVQELLDSIYGTLLFVISVHEAPAPAPAYSPMEAANPMYA